MFVIPGSLVALGPRNDAARKKAPPKRGQFPIQQIDLILLVLFRHVALAR
jgi:hypothetical protein